MYDLTEFDFWSDFNTIWFLDTSYATALPDEYLEWFNLEKVDMGEYGIEHNIFEIYKLTRKN